MDTSEGFNTITVFGEHKLKEKASLFISQVYHIDSAEEAAEYLDKVRRQYYDATHHCYAYRLVSGDFRYSDDGEPNGTAGIRIFSAIEHFELVNVLVVVIRYFGGTKLGVGPLGKVYYSSAFDLLSESCIVHKQIFTKVTIGYSFSQTGQVHHVLSSFDVKITGTRYEDNSLMDLLIQQKDIEALKSSLTDALKGSVTIAETGEIHHI